MAAACRTRYVLIVPYVMRVLPPPRDCVCDDVTAPEAPAPRVTMATVARQSIVVMTTTIWLHFSSAGCMALSWLR